MRYIFTILFLFSLQICGAQYQFSGYVNPDQSSSSVYLSVIEDYRKMYGVYNEQIIAQTSADSNGFFNFKGNLLEPENRIYKIHTDNCNQQVNGTHFNGICTDSYQIVFIAKNTDTLHLPYSFDKQIFCDIESNNPKSIALIKIDSLKEEMKFAYAEYPSEANRRLNNKKWFQKLQDFSENLNEPLAELYAYAYLSDRSTELHSYYAQDLNSNDYYQALAARLQTRYPEATYTEQYVKELKADTYMASAATHEENDFLNMLVYAVLALSLALNTYLLYQSVRTKRKRIKTLKDTLSKQEQVVLEQLLLGKSNKAIAEVLFLSLSTVKTHNNNIYKKLNIRSRDDLKLLFNK